MRIFVSSTIMDLREYRDAARGAIIEAGHEPYLIEEFPATSKPVQQVISEALLACDAIVIILGNRLGTIAPGTDVPWTILETQLAESFGKPVFLFLKKELASSSGAFNNAFNDAFDHAGEHVQTVIGNIAESRLLTVVASPQELSTGILKALAGFNNAVAEDGETISIILPKIQPSDFRSLIAHPESLQTVSSRDFEKLIADLLATDGWDVNLITRHNAPGPDIIAVSSKHIQGVPLKLVVECKRHSRGNPVDVNVVRKVMYWVNEEYRATMGLIATSSRFTSAAIQQANDYHQWRLDLKDQADIIQWLGRQHGITAT